MARYWEQMGCKSFQIEQLINLANGIPMEWVTDSSEIVRNLKVTEHLKNPEYTSKHLSRIQQIFPKMNLHTAIYYNPWLLTLTAETLITRKENFIDLISDCLTLKPQYYTLHTSPSHFVIIPPGEKSPSNSITIQNNTQPTATTTTTTSTIVKETELSEETKNNSYLNANDINELLDWEDIFQQVPQLLSVSKQNLCMHIEVLKKCFAVEQWNSTHTQRTGLTHLEFIDMIKEYPIVLEPNYRSFLSKFRWIVSCVGPVFLYERDLVDIEPFYWKDFPNTNVEMSQNQYRMILLLVAKFAWCIPQWSWARLSRLKYWQYFPNIHDNYLFFKVIISSTGKFLQMCDNNFIDYHIAIQKKHMASRSQRQEEVQEEKEVHNDTYSEEDNEDDHDEFSNSRAVRRMQKAQKKREQRQQVQEIERIIMEDLVDSSNQQNMPMNIHDHKLSKKKIEYLDYLEFVQTEIQNLHKSFDKIKIENDWLIRNKNRLLDQRRVEERMQYIGKKRQQRTLEMKQLISGNLELNINKDTEGVNPSIINNDKNQKKSFNQPFGNCIQNNPFWDVTEQNTMIKQVELLKKLERIHGKLIKAIYVPDDDQVLEFLNTGRLDWKIKSNEKDDLNLKKIGKINTLETIDQPKDATINRPYELQF